MRYRTITRPRHRLAMRNGRVYVHRLVLFEKIGEGQHPCQWCGSLLNWDTYPRIRTDHINGDIRDNRPENVVPSCNSCNSGRSRVMIGVLEPAITMGNGRRTRGVEVQCEGCGEKFLRRASIRDPRRGRFCTRGCANRHRISPHGDAPPE